MTIGLPKAPVTPIYVMYREVVYDPNEEFTKENAGVHAICRIWTCQRRIKSEEALLTFGPTASEESSRKKRLRNSPSLETHRTRHKK